MAGPRIERPRPKDDAPAPTRLILSALVGIGAGLLVTLGPGVGRTMEPPAEMVAESVIEDGTDDAAETAGEGAVEGAAERAPEVAEPAEPAAAPAPEPVAAATPEPTPEPVAAPTPEPTEAPVPSGRRFQIEHGRVAYLRCDGAEQRDALFPCPRDRDLESRARAAIDAVAGCRDLLGLTPRPRGTVDLWLLFEGPDFTELRLRRSPRDTEAALHACLEPRVRGIASAVDAQYMTVSFRFDLQ